MIEKQFFPLLFFPYFFRKGEKRGNYNQFVVHFYRDIFHPKDKSLTKITDMTTFYVILLELWINLVISRNEII